MWWVASIYCTLSGLDSHVACLECCVVGLYSLVLIYCDVPCPYVLVSVNTVLLLTGGGCDSHILEGCSAACSGYQDNLSK